MRSRYDIISKISPLALSTRSLSYYCPTLCSWRIAPHSSVRKVSEGSTPAMRDSRRAILSSRLCWSMELHSLSCLYCRTCIVLTSIFIYAPNFKRETRKMSNLHLKRKSLADCMSLLDSKPWDFSESTIPSDLAAQFLQPAASWPLQLPFLFV